MYISTVVAISPSYPNLHPHLFHTLQKVRLLDRRPPLLPHRLPQLISRLRGLKRSLHRSVLIRRQIDSLLLDWDLWLERLCVAGCDHLGFELALALGDHSAGLLRLS